MTGVSGLIVAVVLLAMNAFFVGAEFALVSARRTQIEPHAANGSRLARIALRAMESVSLVMAAAQLGITLCSIGLGAVAEPAIAHLLEPLLVTLPEEFVHPLAFVISLTLVVFLHVVVGEMVPKNLALANPERAAMLLASPMSVLVTVLRPMVVLLNWVANLSLRLMHVQPRDEVASSFTREEVAGMVDDSRREGLLEAGAYDLLAKTLGFTERNVTSVLIPLSELTALRAGSPLAEVEDACTTTGFSRFPVTMEPEELVGYIHVKDILDTDPERRKSVPLDKWIRPLATVAPHTRLHEALGALRAKSAHLARVVEADGTTLGVVALEDVIEELVGEISDAAQHPAPSVPS